MLILVFFPFIYFWVYSDLRWWLLLVCLALNHIYTLHVAVRLHVYTSAQATFHMFNLFQTGLPKVLTFAGVAQKMGWAMPADFLCISHMKKPLDHCVWTNMTGTDDQLHHWFGAGGRLHGHFNVQDCTSRRSGPNPEKVFFCLTILQRCQSFGPMEDFKPPQQKLGRCLGVTAIMDFHGHSSSTMHLFLSGARPATMGEASWFQKLFDDLKHVLTALLIKCVGWNHQSFSSVVFVVAPGKDWNSIRGSMSSP